MSQQEELRAFIVSAIDNLYEEVFTEFSHLINENNHDAFVALVDKFVKETLDNN